MSTTKTKRFSKATLIEHVEAQMMILEWEYGLDPNNGTAQVKGSDEDRAIAYGEWSALSELRDRLMGWWHDDWTTFDEAEATIARREASA